jgi:hypothetical protein
VKLQAQLLRIKCAFVYASFFTLLCTVSLLSARPKPFARALRDYRLPNTRKEVTTESEELAGRRALVLTLSIRSADFLAWSRHVEVHILGPHFASPMSPVVIVL